MIGEDFFKGAILGLALMAGVLSIFWFAIGLFMGWVIFG